MSELYSHLLIPKDALFVPDIGKVADFFVDLKNLGALPKDAQFIVVTDTGKTRVIGRNPNTGEVRYGPELKINRFPDLRRAIDSMGGKEINELWVQGKGPTAVSPFDLFEAHRPETLRNGPYPYAVRCRERQKITHILRSGFGSKCDFGPDEPGIYENPWNNQPIRTSGLACTRFWVEFGIGDWLMPMITDSLEILDSRLVASAERTFGVKFTQGCLCNDD